MMMPLVAANSEASCRAAMLSPFTFLTEFLADDLAHALEGDVLVVAALGLVAGVKIGLGQLLRLLQALGQPDAAHHAGGLVILPARADQVAAHHRLDRQRLQFFHHDGAVAHLRFLFLALHHALRVDAGQVIRHHVAELAEPRSWRAR
jgi:hypothetical protein